MKDTFNLNDLRSDAGQHLYRQLPSHHPRNHDSNKWEDMIDIMVAALIGSYAYGTLNFDSSATIQL